VPVGRDQVQHIEMARDFGQRFNHLYGAPGGQPHFVLPEAAIEEQVATLPGLDGRKMSKSYDNTIPLFAPRAQLKKLIFSIVTDSRAPGEAKDTDGSALFQLFQAFASPEETAVMRQAFADGIGWGDAKQKLFERIDTEVAPLRDRYEALIAHPEQIELQLRDGARRLRARYATSRLQGLREAVGLRDLGARAEANSATRTAARSVAVFKQYRDADGKFYFKLVEGERVLLQSIGFDSPKDAGARIGALKRGVFDEADRTVAVGAGVAIEDVQSALAALLAAEADKA
jgi:tryptophanyl-tRNA synthetase